MLPEIHLTLLDFTNLIGHLHPLLVHLPIGILLIAVFLEGWSKFRKEKSILIAVPVILFAGSLSAIFSCVSGYLLSQQESYDESSLSLHKWIGIATALVSGIAYALKINQVRSGSKPLLYQVSIGVLFLLIVITGHLGGSITHGSGFITKYLPEPLNRWFGNSGDTLYVPPVVENVQEARIYGELVQPLFMSKCVNCHGPNRRKGGLRLDEEEGIQKGGKDGPVIDFSHPDKSELIRRMLLPLDDDDHMPPKEKKQLSDNEIRLLHWWIDNGADFTRLVREIPQDDSTRIWLTSFESPPEEKDLFLNPDIPTDSTEKADPKIIDSLRQRNVLVMPVSNSSNYLMASFVNAPNQADTLSGLLLYLKDQLIYLNLSGAHLSDTGLQKLGQLKKLVRLRLDETGISDLGLIHLRNLKNLKYLNLVGTRISSNGLLQLDSLTSLKNLYLYRTNIPVSDWEGIKRKFPKTLIDSGGYQVPTLAGDTTEVKAPEKRKTKQ